MPVYDFLFRAAAAEVAAAGVEEVEAAVVVVVAADGAGAAVAAAAVGTGEPETKLAFTTPWRSLWGARDCEGSSVVSQRLALVAIVVCSTNVMAAAGEERHRVCGRRGIDVCVQRAQSMSGSLFMAI